MAMRFAGDFFGVPLVAPEERDNSSLLKYFPELKNIGKQNAEEGVKGARGYGGTVAIQPFTGFKTQEITQERKATAPLFAGFKTFEQPK